MPFSLAEFHPVEANLRESFRTLTKRRRGSEVLELPGVSIASLGVAFQMFNAGFLSGEARVPAELEERLDTMQAHFHGRRQQWSFWVCENWLGPVAQHRLSRLCEQRRLRLSAEMPGMLAARLTPPARALGGLEYRRVSDERTLRDFRAIGALCFHVPPEWFAEVFNRDVLVEAAEFRAWVAYEDGVAVATAASVRAHGALGLYNIATLPSHRRRGVAEGITRHVCAAELAERGVPVVLQSTSQGFRLYERMGFHPVTRILVYSSY